MTEDKRWKKVSNLQLKSININNKCINMLDKILEGQIVYIKQYLMESRQDQLINENIDKKIKEILK